MKYCDDYAALLDLYVDGELSPEEMSRIQEHLDRCPGCQAYVDDALAIRAAFPCKKVAQVVLGLEVNHAHIHLFPINNEADVDFKKHVKLSDEEMKDTADKIFEAFKKL